MTVARLPEASLVCVCVCDRGKKECVPLQGLLSVYMVEGGGQWGRYK